MSTRCVQVTAPARIHFGMLSFGEPQVRQFGGMGAMVEQPAMRLKFAGAERFETIGPLGDRVRQFAEAWSAWRHRDELPACRVEVCDSPECHTGVGTGTQLGLSVAAGLDALVLPDSPQASPAELATATGRGRRSAVGTYGFHVGGLILESGKRPDETIAPLEKRVPVPDAWRFLLLRPRAAMGLSGDLEKDAFAHVPPVPLEATRQLLRLACDVILPAAAAGRFDEFAQGVYKYGYLAGECFAEVQGCAFAGQDIADLVTNLRNWGVWGVGQSSWGPTIFAVLPNASAARSLETRLRESYSPSELGLITTAPNNSGAQIEEL